MTDGVPYDAEIEYLETSSNSYVRIETESFGLGDVIQFDFQPLTNSTGGTAIQIGPNTSGDAGLDGARLYVQSTRVWRWYQRGGTWFNPTYGRTKIVFADTLTTDRRVTTISWTDTTVSGFSDGTPVNIGAILAPFTTFMEISRQSAKLFSFSHTGSTATPHRFIPVRIGTTGFLYDRVSGQLFGNAGTGSFVLGPDVARPVLPARVVSVKPYDAEIEWLESTGTQYVDTGIVPTYDLAYTIDAAWTTSTNDVMMGSVTDLGYISMGWRRSGTSYILHGRTTASSISGSSHISGEKVRFSFDPQTGTAAIDAASGEITRTSINRLRSFLLFGRHIRSDISMTPMRIFGAKFDNGTSTLDLIPVRRGTTGFLYDRVSGQLFGNSGTGSFVLGPDVRVERPLAGLVPVARNVRILPYDAEVEYIESTGTQYVDTGVVPTDDHTIYCLFNMAISGNNKQACVFGCDATSGSNSLYVVIASDGHFVYKIGSTSGTSWPSGNMFAVNPFEVSFLSKTVRTVVPSNPTYVRTMSGSALSVDRSLLLFRRHGQAYNGGRIFACSISLSGTLVRDFRPVRVGTAGYLYDRVTRSLYGSATSTPLIAGPDK